MHASSFLVGALVAAAIETAHSYSLVDSFAGDDFFNHVDFFTDADPTHGEVSYVDFATAARKNYIGTVDHLMSKSSAVYLGVDFQNTTTSGRESVRISTKQSWNHGLFLIDVLHAPVAHGTWPALWLVDAQNGAQWPSTTGEIDLVEYVGKAAANQMTLHTNAGCTVQNASTAAFSGTLLTADCYVSDPAQSTNAGCGIRAPALETVVAPSSTTTTSQHATAGPAFNAAYGGVYALEWTPSAVTIWYHPRAHIPADLLTSSPDPSSWALAPLARFKGCDFDAHLANLSLVVNTDFCGDWAGGVWSADGSAAATGVGSCAQWVRENPEAFTEAYWLLGGVRVFQNTTANMATRKRSVAAAAAGLEEREGRAVVAMPKIQLEAREAFGVGAPAYHVPAAAVQTSGAVGLRAGIERDSDWVSRTLAVLATAVAVVWVARMA